MTERTVSDIILDLEHKVENLSGEVKNMNFTLKLILDRTNAILQNQTTQKVQEIKSEKALLKQPEEITFTDVLPKKKTGTKDPSDKRKIDSNKKPNYKEVNVSQKVVYPDGSPVMLAGVRIFNADKSDITKSLTGKDLVRTVPSGKWNIAIPPGEYTVQIQKEANNSKPAVNITQDFIVTGVEGSLILECKYEK